MSASAGPSTRESTRSNASGRQSKPSSISPPAGSRVRQQRDHTRTKSKHKWRTNCSSKQAGPGLKRRDEHIPVRPKPFLRIPLQIGSVQQMRSCLLTKGIFGPLLLSFVFVRFSSTPTERSLPPPPSDKQFRPISTEIWQIFGNVFFQKWAKIF